MDPVRKWVLIFAAFCLVLLAWYMAADRYTPFTTQARVNAFVVPIAPQVAGEIVSVEVRTNQMVKKGDLLARIDPTRYELAVAAAEAQLALTQQSLRVSSSTVDAARAALDAAKAALLKDTQNEARLKRIDADVPGAISQRNLETATLARVEREAQVRTAGANLQQAIEALGPRDAKNPQLLAARAALDKAQLDLQYTRLVAPNDGLVTDLRVDAGNFAATGQPVMTFVAVHKIWVEAALTENNLGHVKPGDAVDLVLDVWPDEPLRGRVRSVTYGVAGAESTSKPGALPTVQNQRDWLRNAQRFPVLIDFEDPAQAARLGARVGSQVNVLVYTGERPILNTLGQALMGLSRLLSYAY
ncbi:MAG: HlyD family secretion protein [Betaproteobacteria bacterium]|nr:HlyD family secretion protein [Betaproteobacteria bacterium]